MLGDDALRNRSTRTLAWLGDAEFERLVRRALARLGDHPVDRLDTARAKLVRAEAQAELLARIESRLEEPELDVVRRGRNATVRGSGRAVRNVQAYRAATGLEALVGWWSCTDAGNARIQAVLVPALDQDMALALEKSQKPRRG